MTKATEPVYIKSITQAQFEAIPYSDRRRGYSALNKAVLDLAMEEGLQVPCHWEHSPQGQCHGAIGARNFVKRKGNVIKVKTRCYDKVLSILRVELEG